VWSDTFAASPATSRKGYANLRFVEHRYGRGRVREVFDYCIDKQLAPMGNSAIPIVVALCQKKGPDFR
jgi:hypothetical protein